MVPAGDVKTSSSAVSITQRGQDVVQRSTESLSKERSDYVYEDSEGKAKSGWLRQIGRKVRPFVLPALALVILGWWISATVLKATRHRWIIAFRYIPNTVVTRPVEAVWIPAVQKPWYKLPYRTRLAIGWLCLLAIVFGSAFGFKLENQAIALFVLKSRAGFDIFNWIATLAADFLSQGSVGAGFFFDAEVVAKHWFFVNTVSHTP
ncbi:hypothetical protein C0992_009958 [Termitomyces sp. T32_za158]|nr:hypothetical protein C0992_009958 [Termitomyces sp. T32_za158]